VTVATGDPEAEQAAPTALFVYGIVRAETEVPSMTGVAGHQLAEVVHDQLKAVVGEIDVDEPVMRKADLTAYHEVLDRLAGAGPVVPVRFGSALADETSVVESLLDERPDEMLALLDALEGRRQFSLRARYVEEAVLAEVVAEDDDIRRLNERTRGVPEEASWGDRIRLGELVAQAVERRRQGDAADLLDAVLPLVVEHRELNGSGLDHVLEVALLVDDDRQTELEEMLEAYAEAVHERVRLRLVGPLAPYDFAGRQ
jgi:hypothetical protein